MRNREDKIANIDFVLNEDKNEKLIFRFLPQQSSCHSFGDEPPKSWSNVYKVYYAYEIFEQWRWNDNDEWYEPEKLFVQGCDECSELDTIAFICAQLAEGKEVYVREDGSEFPLLNNEIRAFGMGTDWTILKRLIRVWNEDEGDFEWDDEKEETFEPLYTFMLFDYSGVGFRFDLKADKIKAFGEYLKECCEYMLAHGDPI